MSNLSPEKKVRQKRPYEMDDLDRELMVKIRTAVEYEKRGDPMKDVIDECDIAEALQMLVKIVKAGSVIQ